MGYVSTRSTAPGSLWARQWYKRRQLGELTKSQLRLTAQHVCTRLKTLPGYRRKVSLIRQKPAGKAALLKHLIQLLGDLRLMRQEVHCVHKEYYAAGSISVLLKATAYARVAWHVHHAHAALLAALHNPGVAGICWKAICGHVQLYTSDTARAVSPFRLAAAQRQRSLSWTPPCPGVQCHRVAAHKKRVEDSSVCVRAECCTYTDRTV